MTPNDESLEGAKLTESSTVQKIPQQFRNAAVQPPAGRWHKECVALTLYSLTVLAAITGVNRIVSRCKALGLCHRTHMVWFHPERVSKQKSGSGQD